MGKVKLGLLVIITILTIIAGKVFLQSSYPDFDVYYHAAQNTQQIGTPYAGLDENMSYLYPPLTILLFLPLTHISVQVAEKIWLMVSIICFLLSIGLLYKFLRISWRSYEGLVYSALLLLFFPVKFTFGMGQINMVILLLLVLFLYFYERQKVVAGVLLGFAIVIKITPVLFLLYLVLKQEWDTFYTALITVLGLGVISLILYPVPTEVYVFSILPSISHAWPTAYYNQALTGFLGRLPGPVDVFAKLRIVSIIILFSVTVWSFFKEQKNSLLSMSSIFPLILIVSSFSWQHHFVLLIPSFMILSHYLLHEKQEKRLIWFLAILVLSFFLVGYNSKHPEQLPVIFQSHVLYGTLMLWLMHIYLMVKKR